MSLGRQASRLTAPRLGFETGSFQAKQPRLKIRGNAWRILHPFLGPTKLRPPANAGNGLFYPAEARGLANRVGSRWTRRRKVPVVTIESDKFQLEIDLGTTSSGAIWYPHDHEEGFCDRPDRSFRSPAILVGRRCAGGGSDRGLGLGHVRGSRLGCGPASRRYTPFFRIDGILCPRSGSRCYHVVHLADIQSVATNVAAPACLRLSAGVGGQRREADGVPVSSRLFWRKASSNDLGFMGRGADGCRFDAR